MTPDVKSYLDSFINYELNLSAVDSSQFKLSRVERVLSELGNPHKDLKCIHVAGSKGKGSTCVFAANILQAGGYKVGLYTSPHLKNLNERIRIQQDDITDEQLASVIESIETVLEKFRHTLEYGNLTYYEVLTIAAFYYFRRENVDIVVLETGLGGRLDATNVVDSLVCAITPISLEHTQILGNTIAAIAKEKAAIIKSNAPTVIIAPQEKDALKVIEDQCHQVDSDYFYIGKDITSGLIHQDLNGLVFEVKGRLGKYDNLTTSLLGSHQISNAATAIGMIEALISHGFKLSPEAVTQGIGQAQWPGRFEVIQQKPYVILDCAHNPSSSLQLIKTMDEVLPGKKVKLIFGVSDDKDRAGICRNFNEITGEVILTRANHPRACELSLTEMKNYFSNKPITATKNIVQALEMAMQNIKSEDVILIAGSIFIVAEAKEYLETKYAHR
jgi:dihydrofolate synthase/folylpolyglutamate synthase